MSLSPVAVIGALYTASERGLAADVLSARALGLAPLPVCTSIVVASDGRVTDVTDVPVDTVIAQLEHLAGAGRVDGVLLGILGGPKSIHAIADAVERLDVPVVLNVVASGPSGETVLSARGIDALAERLAMADLVSVSRADAELLTGGQIESLDDAQVAAQRIRNRGAAKVLIRCGSLPYRFYDAADDPGGDGRSTGLFADLYYDGDDFALFEAPYLDDAHPDGAASLLALAVLRGLVRGMGMEETLQEAKQWATEGVRQQVAVHGHASRLHPFWRLPSE